MRYLAVLVILLVFIVGCGKKSSSIGLKGSPKDVIGHLKWTVTDAAGATIGFGERDVLLGDVGTEAVDSKLGDLGRYKIPLSEKFNLVATSSEEDSKGFALYGSKDDEETFGWDWFEVSGNTATKLQESGQLGLTFSGSRVSRMDFKTDVSLRLFPLTEDAQDPKWRVTIAQGSHLSFPRG